MERNFIHNFIKQDGIQTRFPPEPNGYLHIGHAKSICLNFGLAKMYNGKCNLRFDDTNPAKEDVEYVESIIEDIKWLGFEWDDLLFASDYFDLLFEFAIRLIKNGKAYICELTPDEIKTYRGSLNAPGKDSPYRNRTVDENLDLFMRMRDGEFADGSKTLRAKIDMASPNINMRDPIIYRIARIHHHNTKDKWCIYPMYDYAHPLEDAIEHITHSICTMEFEDHRPLYDWFVNELEFEMKPQQIEFAKLQLTNTIMGKRYMKELVDTQVVDGWDDPRLVTLSGLRRRGYTPQSIINFCDKIGVAKANSVVDIGLLEHCVREDLQTQAKCLMVVMNPLKVVITNYPEGVEFLDDDIPFAREIYVERDDFMENAPNKFYRLSEGREVRLKSAYFIKCEEVIKNAEGEVVELRCTYDPMTKSGTGFNERKVKGTIHWVAVNFAINVQVRVYDYLLTNDGEFNKNSLQIINAVAEPKIQSAKLGDKFQFIRNGYFTLDRKHSTDDNLVFNKIVALRSSVSF